MASIDVNAIVTQLMEVERQPLKKFDVKNMFCNDREFGFVALKDSYSFWGNTNSQFVTPSCSL